MTKKTKEEKRLASYRKKLRLIQQLNSAVADTSDKTKTDLDSFRNTDLKITTVGLSTEDQNKVKFFLRDLKRSISIIILIITLEFIIYFVSIKV